MANGKGQVDCVYCTNCKSKILKNIKICTSQNIVLPDVDSEKFCSSFEPNKLYFKLNNLTDIPDIKHHIISKYKFENFNIQDGILYKYIGANYNNILGEINISSFEKYK